jgi:hypothetical protein
LTRLTLQGPTARWRLCAGIYNVQWDPCFQNSGCS